MCINYLKILNSWDTKNQKAGYKSKRTSDQFTPASISSLDYKTHNSGEKIFSKGVVKVSFEEESEKSVPISTQIDSSKNQRYSDISNTCETPTFDDKIVSDRLFHN